MSYHTKKVNFWICNIFTRLKLQTIQYTEKLPTLSPICLILATYPQIGTPATSLFVSKTHTTRACTCQPNTYMLPSLLYKWAFHLTIYRGNLSIICTSHLQSFLIPFFFKKNTTTVLHGMEDMSKTLSPVTWNMSLFLLYIPYSHLSFDKLHCPSISLQNPEISSPCKLVFSKYLVNERNDGTFSNTLRNNFKSPHPLEHFINYFKLSWDYKTWIKYTNEIFNIHLWLII